MQINIKRKRTWVFPGKSSIKDYLISWAFYPITYEGKQYVIKATEERKRYQKYAPYRKGCRFELYEWNEKTVTGKKIYAESDLFFPYRKGTGIGSEKMLGWDEFLQEENSRPNKLILSHLQDILRSLCWRYEQSTLQQQMASY